MSMKDPIALLTEAHRLMQAGYAADAKRLLEAEMSHSEKHSALMRAIRATVDGNTYCYLRDTYDSWLVYSCGSDSGPSKLFRCDYSIASDGSVVLADPVEVRQVTTYEPAPPVSEAPGEAIAHESATDAVQTAWLTESVQTCDVPALEAAREGLRSRALLKLIGPGWGASGYYSADFLKRRGPSVLKKGTRNYWNHATESERAERPEGDATKLASVLDEDARWLDAGPKGPGLYAHANLFSDHETAVREKGPHIGVSINLAGKKRLGEAEGRKGWIIEDFIESPLQSVDYVTVAGAGGAVVLTEAAKSGQPALTTDPLREGDTSMDESQVKAIVDQALAAQQSEINALREAQTARDSRITSLETENARLRKIERIREAGTLAAKQLQAAGLPDPAIKRLAEKLAIEAADADTIDTARLAESAKTAAADELAYLQSVGAGAGTVRGMGGAPTGGQQLTEAERKAALASAFAELGLKESTAQIAAAGRFGRA